MKPLQATMHAGRPLDALLRPRSIAIVGISRSSGRQSTIDGSAVLASLLQHRYTGAIELVHPDGGEIEGRNAWRWIAALPQPVDLAVIALAAQRVPAAIAECGARGIRAAVVMSAGFAELGDDDGARLEEGVRDAAQRHRVAICGPNGLGYVNVPDAVCAGYFPCLATAMPKAGGLSIVTHSGAIGNSPLARAIDPGIGIGCVISARKETNVALADYIEYLVDDRHTRVLSVYLEGVTDGRRLRRAFERAAAAGKPVVAYKVGKSAAGAKAALSHTAKIAGEPALWRGLFRQCGVIEAMRLDDLLEIPMLLVKTLQAAARGAAGGTAAEGVPRGIGIVTISGGLGAIIADHFALEGFDVPPLSAATQAALKALPIRFGSTANPVDTTAAIQRDEARLNDILSTVAADPAIDALVFPNASRFPQRAIDVARIIADSAARIDKPLVSVWYAGHDNAEAMRVLHDSAHVACFDDPAASARALAALRDFRSFAARLRERGGGVDGGGVCKREVGGLDRTACSEQASHACRQPALRGMLSEPDGKRLLQRYGVPLLAERTAAGIDEALSHAGALGYPVAMKIVSADIAHKAAIGGVALGLANAAELRTAYDRMIASVAREAPAAQIDGVLIAPMIDIAAELIVGAYVEPTLGPALVVGAGGSRVEQMRDVTMRLLPASRVDCRQMLDEIHDPRIRSLAADVKAKLAAAIDAIATMAAHLQPDLLEVDVNPLALTSGGEVFALDSMLVFRTESPSAKETAT